VTWGAKRVISKLNEPTVASSFRSFGKKVLTPPDC